MRKRDLSCCQEERVNFDFEFWRGKKAASEARSDRERTELVGVEVEEGRNAERKTRMEAKQSKRDCREASSAKRRLRWSACIIK